MLGKKPGEWLCLLKYRYFKIMPVKAVLYSFADYVNGREKFNPPYQSEFIDFYIEKADKGFFLVMNKKKEDVISRKYYAGNVPYPEFLSYYPFQWLRILQSGGFRRV